MSEAQTVLVVDDDSAVLRVACQILDLAGYTVLEASDARTALHLCSARDARIDVLVSDVLMPGICGCDLAVRMKELRPGIKVLLMSGFPGAEDVENAIAKCNAAFIPKPFWPDELIAKLREVLDAP
jgi:two-component system, cell cycle sensor histidine kinase and response regulator CckA